jgi:hypothetical protein
MLRAWVVVTGVAVLASQAHAQQASDGLGIERFRLAIDRAGVLDVEWADVPGHLSWSAGLAVGFAHDPLVVYDHAGNAVDALVEQRLTTSLVGSLALWNRLQLGVALDVVGYQSGSDVLGAMSSLPSSGLGDARLVTKLLVVWTDAYQVAFVPALTVPGGDAHGYLREAGATVSPAIAASLAVDRFRLAANVGYHVKPRVETAGLVSDDEAFARAGVGIALGAPRAPLAELWASTSIAMPIGDADENQIAVEVLGGAARRITPTLDAFLAGGAGLDNGFGTPDWRALAGVRFAIVHGERAVPVTIADHDGDGVADERDRCPTEAEDKDGFQDDDGCIDPDNDGDGIADAQDRCPTQAEDKDGFQDDDGCRDDVARLEGRVVDGDSRPLAGATVRIVQSDLAGSEPIELTVDADGRFTTPIAGGTVEVTAHVKEYKDASVTATVQPGTTGQANVTLARAVRQGQLRGQVLGFDGKPLAATITVKGKTTASTQTDAEGQYTIELPEGSFSVEITSPGHVAQKRSVAIKLDGVTVLNVDLRSGK